MGRYHFKASGQVNRHIPEDHVNDNEYKGCTSKQTYYSKEQAASVALCVRATRQERVYEYECKYCGDWHIGHRW